MRRNTFFLLFFYLVTIIWRLLPLCSNIYMRILHNFQIHPLLKIKFVNFKYEESWYWYMSSRLILVCISSSIQKFFEFFLFWWQSTIEWLWRVLAYILIYTCRGSENLNKMLASLRKYNIVLQLRNSSCFLYWFFGVIFWVGGWAFPRRMPCRIVLSAVILFRLGPARRPSRHQHWPHFVVVKCCCPKQMITDVIISVYFAIRPDVLI